MAQAKNGTFSRFINSSLHNAFYTSFCSIARVLHWKGTPYGEVSATTKRAFVDTTSEELQRDGLEPTIFRIAVTLGLSRQDVASPLK